MKKCVKKERGFKMKLNQRLPLVVLAISILFLASCANNRIVFYPITNQDFYQNDRGDYCMTEFYLNEVMQVKIEKVKR